MFSNILKPINVIREILITDTITYSKHKKIKECLVNGTSEILSQ